MSKSATTVEPPEHSAPRAKRDRARKSRAQPAPTDSVALARAFPTKPLLIGAGIGAALALTAVALGSRPSRSSYLGVRPPTLAGALTKTAVALLARMVARKALAAAANQGARKLANAWPL